MSPLTRVIILVAFASIVGCYHATIETGRTPSTVTIEKSFAAGWIYGLVPPSTVSTAEKCPNGVAKVETQLSFVNQLVNFLTLGIYTPMNIKVTCAASRTGLMPTPDPDLAIAQPADLDAIRRTFQVAADLAVTEDRPVYVKF